MPPPDAPPPWRECEGKDSPDGKHCDHWHGWDDEDGVGCCWCGRLLAADVR